MKILGLEQLHSMDLFTQPDRSSRTTWLLLGSVWLAVGAGVGCSLDYAGLRDVRAGAAVPIGSGGDGVVQGGDGGRAESSSSDGGRTGQGATAGGTDGGHGGGESAAGARGSGPSASGGTGGTETPIEGAGGAASAACAIPPFSAEAAARSSAEYLSWKSAYVVDCPSRGSAVVTGGPGWVASTGIAYGMLLSVGNDDRALFDKLWKYYGDHVDPRGLMNWATSTCDPPGDNNANSATDADLDAAMALLQANVRWGGGYLPAARSLIGKIRQYATEACSGLDILRPGDMFGGCSDVNNPGKVSPSYFAPGYYRVFAVIEPGSSAFWNKLADDSYVLLGRYQAAMEGLVPNLGFIDGRTDGDPYGYIASRAPWRVAVDYLWFCTRDAANFLHTVSAYVDSHHGIAGVPFDANSAFMGSFALSATPLGQAKLDDYVRAWLSAPGDDSPPFQAAARRLYLLTAAGRFVSPLPRPAP